MKFIILILAICLSHNLAVAQQKRDILPLHFEREATPYECFKDNNGNPCAVILVNGSVDGMEVDGTYVFDAEQMTSERFRIIVAIPKKEGQYVTLRHPEWNMALIPLWNQTEPLRGNSVYYVAINQNVNTEILRINSSPSGADVSINGRNVGQTPYEIKNLAGGEIKLRLSHKDCYLLDTVIATVPTPKEINCDLRRKTGRLKVETNFKDSIFVNDRFQGCGNIDITVPAGQVFLRLNDDRYTRTPSSRIYLVADETQTVKLNRNNDYLTELERAKNRTVSFYTNPSGADVYMYDKCIGKTPCTIPGLWTSEVPLIIIRCKGYASVFLTRLYQKLDITLLPVAKPTVHVKRGMNKTVTVGNEIISMVPIPGGNLKYKGKTIRISPFYCSITEVPQSLFEQVMGKSKNKSSFKGKDYPMEFGIDYCYNKEVEALQFIKELNKITGLNFRMMTEAEWDYIAQIDETSGVDTSIGWTGNNSGMTTHPVGLLQPNSLGLYDFYGNLSEICRGSYYTNNIAEEDNFINVFQYQIDNPVSYIDGMSNSYKYKGPNWTIKEPPNHYPIGWTYVLKHTIIEKLHQGIRLVLPVDETMP